LKTILIVEDDEILRQSISTLLESEGYEVFSAAGGVEALEILEKLKPALIITDIIMEGTDGFDIILHTKKQIPETKIIAISGGSSVGTERYMDTAKSLGVDHSSHSAPIKENRCYPEITLNTKPRRSAVFKECFYIPPRNKSKL
jgi:CheY-like chemotaxis protein